MASSKRDVSPHPLVAALQPDPSKPPIRAVKLFGFPGQSPEPKTTRLWLDAELHNYVDVPNASILYSQTLPDDGGTILWAAPDAALVHGSTLEAPASAFLSGSIASQHLGLASGAGAPAAGPVPQAISLVSPCISLPAVCHPSIPCPTHLPCPVSLAAACPTSPHICASAAVVCHPSVPCPTHLACPVTLAVPCPTRTFVCHPTLPVVCNVSLAVVCPTHTIVCHPTSPVICNISALSCPTHLCPSSGTPCISVPCPTGICPSLACGGPTGVGGT